MKIAVIVADFNPKITDGLLEGAKQYLSEKNIPLTETCIFRVPGAFEIPLIAKRLANSEEWSGIICLGAVVKGDTAHFEYISDAVAHGIMNVSLETEIPVSFGVLTTYTTEQALERSQIGSIENKGREAAHACFESCRLLKEI